MFSKNKIQSGWVGSRGGAREPSGIFEKIFRAQFQFTKETRYNKGMEHMEHFYKDDSSIITHTI